MNAHAKYLLYTTHGIRVYSVLFNVFDERKFEYAYADFEIVISATSILLCASVLNDEYEKFWCF